MIKKRFANAARMATTLATGLLVYTTSAHATVFDQVGNYMYGGFTGPLAKGISVPLLS